MKTLARMELKPGMVLSEDVTDYGGKLLCSEGDVLSENDIKILERHNIIAVSIKEDIDLASTHFEKVMLSPDFQKFRKAYEENMPAYRRIIDAAVYEKKPVDVLAIMKIYSQLVRCASTGERMLDFLYNMMPGEEDVTYAHTLNSAIIAGVFSKWLDITQNDTFIFIVCGFLYDIGKLLVPAEILNKPGKLTEEEFDIIKSHAKLGQVLLDGMQGLDPVVARVALQHHERMDGSGYPSHLKGDEIDRFARYISIVDAYEAMTRVRVYRMPLNPFQVIANFEKDGTGRYDMSVLTPIMKHVASTQLGFEVVLSNGMHGTIILLNEKKLSRPLIKNTNDEIVDLMVRTDLEIQSIY